MTSDGRPSATESGELRADEERYRHLFDSIDQGFCIIRVLFDERDRPVDYRFVEVNAAFEAQTGLADAEGDTIRSRVPDHEEHWFEIYGRVAKTGEPESFEEPAAALGRWYSVYAFRVGEPDERLVAILFNDITERKELEAARERQRRQLRDARDEAERASRSKSRFISTINHELRTPLQVMMGIIDVMEAGVAGPLNDRQKDHLSRMKTATEHMVGIVDELLAFSRAEHEDVIVREVDVAEIARGVVEILRSGRDSSDLELDLHGADDAVVWPTDGPKVRQILTNLIDNAVKYTEDGSVDIELRADGERLEVRVRDTGPGIAPARQKEIFDPFTRLRGATSTEESGTGLGLTICRHLANLLGGELDLESAPGEGSTFTLRLPRDPGRDAAPADSVSRDGGDPSG